MVRDFYIFFKKDFTLLIRSKEILFSLLFFNLLFAVLVSLGCFILQVTGKNSVLLIPIVTLLGSVLSALFAAERFYLNSTQFNPVARVRLYKISTLLPFLSISLVLYLLALISFLTIYLYFTLLLPGSSEIISLEIIFSGVGFFFGFSILLALFLQLTSSTLNTLFLLPLILIPLSLPLFVTFYQLNTPLEDNSLWLWLLIFLNLIYLTVAIILNNILNR